MHDTTLKDLEHELLITAIYKRYAIDLSGYTHASLKRRVCEYIKSNAFNHVSELIPLMLHNPTFFMHFLADVMVSVTELFRDPRMFLEMRKRILPILKELPYLKIWHAGCATGEEVYALAIILHELKMLNKCTIYATDINALALDVARIGIYSKKDLAKYSMNYRASGGTEKLSDYYIEKYEHIRFHRFLRENITFAEHNLATFAPFDEVNLIFCRNVFIYLERSLQNHIALIFANNLVVDGVLVLGASETLKFLTAMRHFDEASSIHKIYKKKLCV